MNEDDTFRVLARPNVHEMEKLWQELRGKNKHRVGTERVRFAKYWGWGWGEFLKAKKEAGYTGH